MRTLGKGEIPIGISEQSMGIAIVELAQPADAENIYKLLVEAFTSSSLPFSIYQSPNSVKFIKSQIEERNGSAYSTFHVLRCAGKLAGFYNAVINKDEYFLNHIATSAATRKKGLGSLLLRNFEAEGAFLSCKTLGLDVFRTNSAAVVWYGRCGYQTITSRFRGKFELSQFVNLEAASLDINPESLSRAIMEESQRGFSAITCLCSGISIRLGFISGDACNLLSPSGDKALAVAGAIARYFKGNRQWLLATSQDDPFSGWPQAKLLEEAVYMKKPLENG